MTTRDVDTPVDLDDVSPGDAPEVETVSPADPVDDQDGHVEDLGDEDPGPRGTPAGHLLVGGVAVLTVGLGVLWTFAGAAGLVVAGLVAGGGGAAYLRFRRGGTRAGAWPFGSGKGPRGGSGKGSRLASLGGLGGRSGGRTGGRAVGGLLGGRRTGTGGRNSVLGSLGSGGRRKGVSGLLGGAGRRAARGTGRGRGASGGRGTGGKAHRGPIRSAAHRAARSVGRAGRRAGSFAGRHARRAGAWVNARTGGRAGKALGWTGRQVRRAAGWADRKTGRRFSAAWHAAKSATGFRQARRRAAAVLGGWDAELTAGLVALIAWLTGKWRARKSRSGAPEAATESQAASSTGRDDPKEDTTTTTSSTENPSTGPENITGPAPAPDRRTHRRSTTMSGFPLVAVAAEMNAAAAAHAPVDMFAVARELDQLGEVPTHVAMALRTYTQRLQGDYPIDPTVVEAIHGLYAAQAQLVQVAEEIGPLFRRVHAEDLKREEAPRTNEQAWNV